jgi:signal transduction histidine kinase
VGAVIVDTTERKRAEDALRKTEKLAAAGRLAASIAHEINNPLEAVTNLLYLLCTQKNLDSQARAYAELAQHEVARVSEITQQTLRFYRQSSIAVMSNVSELLDSVLALHLGRVHALRVEVYRRYERDVSLYCFAGELRQLFANLVGNALDAMLRSGGTLRLSVRKSRSWRNPDVTGVRISVCDTGSGMTPAVRLRIFEPFFTTKEDTGTGLGLWVSAEIVQKHGGVVRVRSRAAETIHAGQMPGTIFMLFFPSRLPDPTTDTPARAVATPIA